LSTAPAAPEIYTLSLHDALPICQFRLWLTIQDAIRLVDHGYHGDQKLAPLIRSYVLGSEDGEKWAVIDSLLARTRIEATRFESRSEEHTSELQSRENLVCRLLLE